MAPGGKTDTDRTQLTAFAVTRADVSSVTESNRREEHRLLICESAFFVVVCAAGLTAACLLMVHKEFIDPC